MSLIQPETTTLRRPSRGHAADAQLAGPAATTQSVQWLLEGTGFTLLRLAVDLVAVVVAVAVAAGGPAELVRAGGAPELLVVPPLAVLLLAVRGLYSRRLRTSVLDGVVPIVGAITIATMAAVVLNVYVGSGPSQGRVEVIAWFAALAGVSVGRMGLIFLQRWARTRELVGRPTLIVGTGVIGTQIARRLLSDPQYGLRPVGFVDGADMMAVGEPDAHPLPVLGDFAELRSVVERTGAQHVIIAFSGAARDSDLQPFVRECEELQLEVSLVPRMFEAINDRLAYETLGGLPLLGLRTVDPKGWQFTVKHALDQIAAVILLLASAPLLALIALAIRLESPGPTLFRQRRVGRDGQAFDLLKFRSMRVGPSADAFIPRQGHAPGGVEGIDRRTRVGRLLRRTSLDELPQLVNVLRGEMSLVGPRPERPEFVELFGRDLRRYGDRHRVRSGLTGWAQVHGYRGQTSLADRVEWDNYYIEYWSLGLDLKILLMTLVVLFKPAE